MPELKQVWGWLQGFVQKRIDDIVPNFFQKGGWEGWAQVELEKVFQRLPGDPAVLREQAIYDGAQEGVDFLIRSRDSTVCVELKCESLYQSAGDGRVTKDHQFYKKIEEDMYKLDRRLPEYQRAEACCIAITISEEAAAGVKRNVRCDDIVEFPVVDARGERWIVRVFLVKR